MLEHERYGSHEHACVPDVVPCFYIFVGNFTAGLLSKLSHGKRVRSAFHVQRFTGADVAEAGGRVRGLDADRDDLARGSGVNCLAHSVLGRGRQG